MGENEDISGKAALIFCSILPNVIESLLIPYDIPPPLVIIINI